MRIPVTRHAYVPCAVYAAVPGLVGLGCGGAALAGGPAWLWAPAGLGLGLALFVLAFFRDPVPTVPPGDDVLVSPATGKVTDVTEVEAPPFLEEPAVRVGIFLSIFDVHVNRSPASGEVRHLEHSPGRFVNAMREDAGEVNEANDLGLETPGGLRLLVRQVAGLVARRIICPVSVGDRLEKGFDYGMIRFGSRTELLVPLAARPDVRVAPGDRVRGGETVLATVGEPGPVEAPGTVETAEEAR